MYKLSGYLLIVCSLLVIIGVDDIYAQTCNPAILEMAESKLSLNPTGSIETRIINIEKKLFGAPYMDALEDRCNRISTYLKPKSYARSPQPTPYNRNSNSNKNYKPANYTSSTPSNYYKGKYGDPYSYDEPKGHKKVSHSDSNHSKSYNSAYNEKRDVKYYFKKMVREFQKYEITNELQYISSVKKYAIKVSQQDPTIPLFHYIIGWASIAERNDKDYSYAFSQLNELDDVHAVQLNHCKKMCDQKYYEIMQTQANINSVSNTYYKTSPMSAVAAGALTGGSVGMAIGPRYGITAGLNALNRSLNNQARQRESFNQRQQQYIKQGLREKKNLQIKYQNTFNQCFKPQLSGYEFH